MKLRYRIDVRWTDGIEMSFAVDAESAFDARMLVRNQLIGAVPWQVEYVTTLPHGQR